MRDERGGESPFDAARARAGPRRRGLRSLAAGLAVLALVVSSAPAAGAQSAGGGEPATTGEPGGPTTTTSTTTTTPPVTAPGGVSDPGAGGPSGGPSGGPDGLPPRPIPPAPSSTVAPRAPVAVPPAGVDDEPTAPGLGPRVPGFPGLPPSPSTSTTTTTTRPPPTTAPPVEAGDEPPPPADAARLITAQLQAKINSVRRSGPNSSDRLMDALAPLRERGLDERAILQAGFGRFPVGGRARYTDDWWFPRFTPSVHLHEGTDIFAAAGTPVRSPAHGTLRLSSESVGGLAAYVREANGTYYYMAHLQRFERGVATGQTVTIGQIVGYVGTTGNARGTSPHVHFEVHPNGGGPVNPKRRLDAWLAEALAAVPRVLAETAPAAPEQAPVDAPALHAVGHSDLGGAGPFGPLAVVGRRAVVATGPPCAGSLTLVDLADPASPLLSGRAPLPEGMRAEDIDARRARTPSFTGELAAVLLAPCSAGTGPATVAFYDVTGPEGPRLLGRSQVPGTGGTQCGPPRVTSCDRPPRSVELAGTADRPVATVVGEAVSAFDVADPAEPASLDEPPTAPGPQAPAGPCGPGADAREDVELPSILDIPGAPPAPGPGTTAGEARPEGPAPAGGWNLHVDAPVELAGDIPACPLGPVPAPAGPGAAAGQVAYLGRGCPDRADGDGNPVAADTYLGDPAGRVALVEAGDSPLQPDLPGPGCPVADRVARARSAGAVGLVVLGGTPPPAATASPASGPPGAPAVQVSPARAAALRDALCPALDESGLCSGGTGVAASVVEPPTEGPGAPLPPAAALDGERAYAPAGPAGLRVLDLSSGGPEMMAVFVPAGPPGVNVVGVDQTADHIVVSDATSGVWVLDKRPPAPPLAPAASRSDGPHPL